ncbi:hypothetical protein TTHERM_00120780 (macronuclear) [Tetrahymena thermophila SB210]|uniref:Leucine Rich Repeat family protein n=1 Tax=Tetrahymena thermophila (strain SB210) TaxID=312017 RepID=Q22YY9_TETTS|nr:hypothetical protein TTHERM_00120780 [Tetrahymena thermophila SB210]EAR90532.2 hypothetical protein TTHERM_00120780 [Tetrahymena thermophila SB210]|eukprot:XP_001010777.2 hypothetical protein TTHERM_00120780 [Tetrahymena thermophila SB210]
MKSLPKLDNILITLQKNNQQSQDIALYNQEESHQLYNTSFNKFYSPKVDRVFYKVDLNSLTKFRNSSQSTNDSIEEKKLNSNSDITHSRKSTLKTPSSLTNIFLNRRSKDLSQSQILLNSCAGQGAKKVQNQQQVQLDQIDEQKKINFKEYMAQQQKKKIQAKEDKIRQKLLKMNTPFDETTAFPNKLYTNQQSQQVILPQIVSQKNQNETAGQKKFIEIDQKLQKFNTNYKKIGKIVDSNSYFHLENTLEVAMLSAIENNNIIPKRMNIIKDSLCSIEDFDLNKNNYKYELDLSNQNINEGQSKMVQSVLQHPSVSKLRLLSLKNSSLTARSLVQIATHLPISIQEINLEQNRLGSHDLSFALTPLLQSRNYPFLKSLNIENNKIGDLGFHSILSSLQKSSLSILNISNNNLTDASSEGISLFLRESQEINELYLHWNKFSSQGGIAIAKGLEKNISLQVLDMSYNGLGNPKGVKSGLKIIKSCSHQFGQIKHLDLSFNMLTKEETVEISNFLSKSNFQIGLHYLGNQGDWIVDSRGFLVQINSVENARAEQLHYSKQRIQGLKCVKQKQKLTSDILNTDICWICDGWQEIKFEITAESSSTFAKHPVFLHLDFENYRPHYMDPDPENPNKFILKRMCPPNRRIQFFFSDPTQKVLYYSHDYPSMGFMKNQLLGIQFYNKELNKQKSIYSSPQVSANNKYANFFQKKFFKLQYLDTTVIEYQEPFLVNWIETSNNSKLFTSQYDALFECKPRWPETFFKINFTNEWTFEKSIFSTYIRDSDNIISECFEFDWENSRLDKILSQYCINQQMKDDCKEILKKEYNLIRCVYKYYASLGIVGDIPCISQNQFSNIALKMKLTDGKNFKISDLDYNFITVNSSKNKEKNYRNPDKAMIRFEFLEVIARIAIDKYIRSGACKNAQESLCNFFSNKQVREKFEEIEDPQAWRDTKYWIEECDIIIQNNLEMIQGLWNKWANSKKSEKRGFQTTQTMSINEFIDMVKNYNLLDDFLTERDILLAFNLAMMTQVDELNNDRFIQMTFVEFLEAIARLADKKCMLPLGTVDGSYNLQERQQVRLEFKLESLLDLIKQRIIQQNKDKQKQSINIKEKQQNEEQEIVHTPLVPSVQLQNIQQKQLGIINSSRKNQDSLKYINSSLQFSQESISNDF